MTKRVSSLLWLPKSSSTLGCITGTILLASEIPPCAGAAEQITVSGFITHLTYSPGLGDGSENNSIKRSKRSEFRCEFIGCTWRIQTRDTGESAKNTYSTASDGTNTYWVRTGSSSFATLLATNPSAIVVSNQATVTEGIVPVLSAARIQSGSFAAPIWFTYASSCYLDTLRTNRMRPIWVVHATAAVDSRFDPFMHLERADDWPRLPVGAVFFTDGLIPGKTPESRPTRRPEAFRDGWKVAEYEVNAFTNTPVGLFPLTARLRTFGPVNGATNPDDVEVKMEWQLETTSIRESRSDAPSPSLPPVVGLMEVEADARISRKLAGHYNRYLISNRWLLESDPRFRSLKAKATILERKLY